MFKWNGLLTGVAADGAEKLKPCPFCKGTAAMGDNERRGALTDTWFIVCLSCEAQGPTFSDGSEGPRELPWSDSTVLGFKSAADCMRDAISGWNSRAEN
jgi:hypothetical protein